MATTQYYNLLIIEGSSLIGSLANDNPQKIDTALHGLAVDIGTLKSRVPAPGSGDTGKFLRGDGSWQNIPLPGQATSSALGTLKIGYSESGRYYALKLDANGKGYVYVPWEDHTYNDATTSAHGLMTAADKTKLNGIAAGAQVNPGVATTSANGLMSSSDKSKLNGISAGAQVNPGAATQSSAGLMSAADKKKLDGIATGAQVNPGVATTSANGLMAAADKTKLNGISAGAQVNPGNFGGATASKAGSAGLVPAPAAGGQYKVVYGEGGWASIQDLINVVSAKAYSGIQSTAQKIEFRLGNQDNVAAINGEVAVNFSPAFSNGCHIVIPVLRSNLNGVYNRFCCYDWGKTGFKYKAQNGSTSNISFTWLAIGY